MDSSNDVEASEAGHEGQEEDDIAITAGADAERLREEDDDERERKTRAKFW